jgi:FeS assembly SUF system regulator
MLRLNRMTDYAILVLAVLAARQNELVTSAAIAHHTQLNQTTIAKIGKELVRCGIIVAERGANGGYRLARKPIEITAAQVIEAIEGPIALTACVEGVADPCETRHGCFMSGNWNEVNDAIRTALNSLTLEKLCDPETLFPEMGPTATSSYEGKEADHQPQKLS